METASAAMSFCPVFAPAFSVASRSLMRQAVGQLPQTLITERRGVAMSRMGCTVYQHLHRNALPTAPGPGSPRSLLRWPLAGPKGY